MHAKQPISSMRRLLVVRVVGNLETSRRIGVKVQHFNTPSRPAITSSTAPTVSPSKPSMSCALLYKLQVRATTCKQWMQWDGCHEAVKQGRTEWNQHRWIGVELSSHTRVGRSCHAMALPFLINRGVDGSWRGKEMVATIVKGENWIGTRHHRRYIARSA